MKMCSLCDNSTKKSDKMVLKAITKLSMMGLKEKGDVNMNTFMKKLEDTLMPIAQTLGNQRHLLAIRDGFTVIMPLMIIGALVVAINNLPIEAFQNFMNSIFKFTLEDGSPIWKSVGGNVWNGTFGIMSMFMAFLIGDNLGESYGMNGKIAGATGLASFAAIGGLNGMGSTGLFVAIIIALVSVELLRFLANLKALTVTMPEGVPSGVAAAFNNMFPMMITVTLVGLVATLLARVGIPDVINAFYEAIQQPFMGLTSTWVAAVILAIIPPLFWFFGIHGANMIDPFMQMINVPAIDENIAALAAGKAAPNIVNKPFFDAFVNMGGTGTTIALIIAVFLVARQNKKLMTVSTLSIGPGLFNINEPISFGLPVVLNPILFIPYVVGPVIITLIAYFATAAGLVPAATMVIPWVTPPVIGGFLATQSIAGAILSLVNLVIMVVIYIPFIMIQSKADANDEIN